MIRDNDKTNRLRNVLRTLRERTQPTGFLNDPKVVTDLWSIADQMITSIENDL